MARQAKNVLGTDLEICCTEPMTGFYRDGCCRTGGDDAGLHLICTQVTDKFLEYSKSTGNDLSTPNPMYDFPGLKPGDRWCVCAQRWKQAMEAGAAAPIVLAATHISMLEFVSLEELRDYALDAN